MDRFKLNTSDYISYEITSNNFDKLTNKTYPFVQKALKASKAYMELIINSLFL